ncbi:MAG: hypothetical protein GQ534_07765 [Candidatus Delongbacteria bacterium]|nr:hypothetical protein [Candidatus Delongbacteria bacterium]
MNLIAELNSRSNVQFTLDKYDISDMSTGHAINMIFNNWNDIHNYYEKTFNHKICSIDDYIDFLFLKYLILYQDCIDNMIEPHKSKLSDILVYLNTQIENVKKSDIINFLMEKFIDVFKYENKYIRRGIHKLTLDIFVCFKKGFKSSGLLEYLLKEEALFVFDNLNVLNDVIKKSNKVNYSNLFFDGDNFKLITDYRFNNLCETTINLYKNNNYDLAEDLGNGIYKFCSEKFENHEENDLIFLNDILEKGVNVLESIKSEHTPCLLNSLNIVSKELKSYLMKYGEKLEVKYSTKEYSIWMEKLDKLQVPLYVRYMTVSHIHSLDSKTLKSKLEQIIHDYKPTIIDHIVKDSNTNDYFTKGKLLVVEDNILFFLMPLFYWIDGREKSEQFFNTLLGIIEGIYTELDYNWNEDELKMDITQLKIAFHDTKNNVNSSYYYYMCSFYIISLLEKFLRIIYCHLDKQGFFLKSTITLSTILGDKNKINKEMSSLIGADQLRWVRYYLLHDGDRVGHNLRNKIAHYRDIRFSDITEVELMRIMWLFISTVNSIYANILNKKNNTGK